MSRLRGRLDHLLTPFARSGLDRVEPEVLILLRMGLYQLLRMDRVPDYAAVSQTVEQVVGIGRSRARGFVNAVLRRAGEAGEGPDRFPDRVSDPGGYLTAWGSHPRWLVDRWLNRWSFERVHELLEANNSIPATHLVPLDDELEVARAKLADAGIDAIADPLSGTLRLPFADPTKALELVPGFVQDPAAALVCRYAAVPEGGVVADLCSAPGGKALSLARRSGYLLAADPTPGRLRTLRENVRRTGLQIGVVRARGESPPTRDCDLVLVDAPCSGTGTLRRHPDARWRLEEADVERLSSVQARILHGAAGAVRPGGWLVYSTCTLEPEENREQVEAFLRAHPEFELDPPGDEELELEEDGVLEVWPRAGAGDGAFAARMVRSR